MTALISNELLDQVSAYVTERMGLSFPKERRSDLKQGLLRAAAEFGFNDAASCARWLMLSPLTKAQVETLASHLTVGETYFFRDRAVFDFLETRILPELLRERRDAGRSLRVWSAGCATGEEPYSIAMLLRRIIPDIHEWNITILGTDINPSFLRKASQGVYGEWSFRDVPSWVKDRCFRKIGKGRYSLLPEIRSSVSFSYHNLAEDSYPSLTNNTNAMDIIFCRNVLMYFSRGGQQEVVGKFSHCLVEGGLLIVSPIEFSAALGSGLSQMHVKGAAVFRRDSRAPAFTPWQPLPSGPGERPAPFAQHVPLSTQMTSPAISAPEPGKASEPDRGAGRRPDTYREALASYGKGNYAEAEEKINLLLAGGENAGPALALLARIRANRGGLGEARELCEKAISADKMDPSHHYLYATVLQELGLAQEAVASLKRALYLDQNFVLAHFALAIFSFQQGKTREAERHFENARAALRNYALDDVLPESEGITAGRMDEIITAALQEESLV